MQNTYIQMHSHRHPSIHIHSTRYKYAVRLSLPDPIVDDSPWGVSIGTLIEKCFAAVEHELLPHQAFAKRSHCSRSVKTKKLPNTRSEIKSHS